jgi:hypothetical protein
LDTEWLLSTLFDASLLSTIQPPETAAFFCSIRPVFPSDRLTGAETISVLIAGLRRRAAR